MHPLIQLRAVLGLECHSITALQKYPDLLQALSSFCFHADDQLPACGSSVSPSGSSCIRNKPLLQAHLVLDKTATSNQPPPWRKIEVVLVSINPQPTRPAWLRAPAPAGENYREL